MSDGHWGAVAVRVCAGQAALPLPGASRPRESLAGGPLSCGPSRCIIFRNLLPG